MQTLNLYKYLFITFVFISCSQAADKKLKVTFIINIVIQVNDPNEIYNLQTIFVMEYIRHGARSHYEDNVNLAEFFQTAKKGYVTPKGKADMYRIGQHRRREYVDKKKFLSSTYNEEEILSLATFVQRCSTSGQYFMRGLYPLHVSRFDKEFNHADLEFSPIKGTTYETIIKSITDKS